MTSSSPVPECIRMYYYDRQTPVTEQIVLLESELYWFRVSLIRWTGFIVSISTSTTSLRPNLV